MARDVEGIGEAMVVQIDALGVGVDIARDLIELLRH